MSKYEDLEKLAFHLQKKALYGSIPVQASRGALSQAFGRAAMMGAIGLGAGALAEMASSPIGTVPNTIAKGRSFQQMLDGSERVRALHAVDPSRVTGMFGRSGCAGLNRRCDRPRHGSRDGPWRFSIRRTRMAMPMARPSVRGRPPRLLSKGQRNTVRSESP